MKKRIALSFALVAGLVLRAGAAEAEVAERIGSGPWRSSTRRTPTPASPPPITCSANFADTEFKAIALQVAAASAQQKNDFEKMVVYAERTLEADPKNYPAMLMLANGSPSAPASSISTRKRSSTAPKSTRTRQWIS